MISRVIILLAVVLGGLHVLPKGEEVDLVEVWVQHPFGRSGGRL